MIKKALPFIVGVAVIAGSVGLGVNAASAHDDAFKTTCTSASLDLTNYPNGSTVGGTFDSQDIGSITFGTEGYHGQIALDPAVQHSWDITVKSGDGNHAYDKHYQGVSDPSCVPVQPPVTTPPTGEPSTPPSTPPVQVVIEPHIQDYITCKGAAFVLDNTGSTEAVEYSINGLKYAVAAGEAIHTDADGTLIQPNSDYEGYTITAGEKTWNFPSQGNCPTTPPVTPEPTPTDTPTSPPVTPPTTETPTPVPSTEPTGSPTAQTPTVGPTGSSSVSPTVPTKTDSGTTQKTLPTDDTARTLAYTGSNLTFPLVASIVLVLLGLGAYIFARIRRRK